MQLDAVFYPKSVAVIGASKQTGSVGNEISKNLIKQGYRGKLYLVNPKGGRLYGRKVLVGLDEIEAPLDLAIIAIPAELVVDEVKRLLDLNVCAIIVISSGFLEAGNQKAEDELVRICKEKNIALIGPNCLGVINPDIALNASFAPIMPASGPVAFISQSGALCASVLDYASRLNLGFSKFISVGNKALIGEAQLLEYLYHDKKTKIIGLYMEEVDEVNLIKHIASKITHGRVHKPIVVLKSGRTDQGRKAALSHTGSLGGSDSAYEALFSQTGMIRAQTIEELFDILECFTRNRALTSERVAVITNAGGPGVLTADALVAKGLKLAQISDGTVTKLKKFLPKGASVNNPIDILGDADARRYQKTLATILEDKGVDAVEVILTPQSMTEVRETARIIVNLKKNSTKPIVVSFVGQGLVKVGVDILNQNKVATSFFPESGTSALAALNIFHKWVISKRQKPMHFKNVKPKVVQKILDNALSRKQNLLMMNDSFDALSAYGFPTVKRWTVTSRSSAQDLAAKIRGPLVLKILSGDINHKSDVGAVVLNVESSNLADQYQKLVEHVHKVLPYANVEGVNVMPMVIGENLEIIIGAKTDPKLGKQILVGLGGVYAEVFADISWGLAPVSRGDIQRMIGHLKLAKILAGFRSHEPLATDKIIECLARLSQLVVDFPVIKEVDINPLIVMSEKKGVAVVDARIVVNKNSN